MAGQSGIHRKSPGSAPVVEPEFDADAVPGILVGQGAERIDALQRAHGEPRVLHARPFNASHTSHAPANIAVASLLQNIAIWRWNTQLWSLYSTSKVFFSESGLPLAAISNRLCASSATKNPKKYCNKSKHIAATPRAPIARRCRLAQSGTTVELASPTFSSKPHEKATVPIASVRT